MNRMRVARELVKAAKMLMGFKGKPYTREDAAVARNEFAKARLVLDDAFGKLDQYSDIPYIHRIASRYQNAQGAIEDIMEMLKP
jgi:hypothetical protein